MEKSDHFLESYGLIRKTLAPDERLASYFKTNEERARNQLFTKNKVSKQVARELLNFVFNDNGSLQIQDRKMFSQKMKLDPQWEKNIPQQAFLQTQFYFARYPNEFLSSLNVKSYILGMENGETDLLEYAYHLDKAYRLKRLFNKNDQRTTKKLAEQMDRVISRQLQSILYYRMEHLLRTRYVELLKEDLVDLLMRAPENESSVEI